MLKTINKLTNYHCHHLCVYFPWMEEFSGTTLTDTFWAAVTPLWCASVPGMAGNLAGAFQLVTLVTGEADYRADRKASFGPH